MILDFIRRILTDLLPDLILYLGPENGLRSHGQFR